MLGWHISVLRQTDGGEAPARADSEPGSRVAVWQTNASGLAWLNALVAAGEAQRLSGNGYPTCYTAQAAHLLPQVISGPPEAHAIWLSGVHDVITAGWAGRTVIDHEVVGACRPDEWLLVVAWDES